MGEEEEEVGQGDTQGVPRVLKPLEEPGRPGEVVCRTPGHRQEHLANGLGGVAPSHRAHPPPHSYPSHSQFSSPVRPYWFPKARIRLCSPPSFPWLLCFNPTSVFHTLSSVRINLLTLR